MAEYKLNRITRPNNDLLRVRGDIKYIVGTGTAAKTSTPYRFAKWEASDPNIDQLFDGLTIAYKIAVKGNGTYGTCLQINDTGYHPVVSTVSTMIGTRYGVGAVILLVYVSNIAQSVYGTADGDTATEAAAITGCWYVVNDYDSGNTKNTVGSTDTSDKIFLVGAKSQATSPTSYSQDTAYVDTDGHLYSNSQRVVNWGEVDDSTDGLSRSSTDTAVPTSKAVVNYIDNQGFLTSYTETDPTVPSWAKESSKPSYTYSEVGAAASNHAHGNITNGGDITATAPTIANGDQIIINDNSASKITNGPTFDGSTTTKALTPKGTWEAFAKSSDIPEDYVVQVVESSTNGRISVNTVSEGSGSVTTVYVHGLAGAAYKAVDSSISAGSSSTNVPTSAAVRGLVDNEVTINTVKVNGTTLTPSNKAVDIPATQVQIVRW